MKKIRDISFFSLLSRSRISRPDRPAGRDKWDFSGFGTVSQDPSVKVWFYWDLNLIPDTLTLILKFN